ncbi:hypothetical protein QUF90_24710 [Desulfococcaceae bacterium HSG9]|nr:hypothetical protein [Desulfococcaceae bacterium HSG9]
MLQKKIGGSRPGPDSIYEDRVRIAYESHRQRNQTAIDRKALTDGTFLLITNTDKPRCRGPSYLQAAARSRKALQQNQIRIGDRSDFS